VPVDVIADRNGDISFNRLTFDDPTYFVDLFSVRANGSGLTQLTNFGPFTGAEFSDHSPDGRTIAFHVWNDATETPPQIYTADADGRNPRQLTDDPCGVADPAFSPDGRTLVVDACPGDVSGIFLIPARSKDGKPIPLSAAQRITRRTDGGFDTEPQISPDGKWIMFTRYSVECTDDATFENCQTAIYKIRTSGKDLRHLVGPEYNPSAPDWHPSGLGIAFDTHDNRLAPNAGDIMVALADGSHKQVNVAFTHWPLNPDGENADSSEIWTAWITGHGRQRLTSGANDNKADWGPKPR
jgi:Tol biopolymer transport system component